jgi:hypothetical protein
MPTHSLAFKPAIAAPVIGFIGNHGFREILEQIKVLPHGALSLTQIHINQLDKTAKRWILSHLIGDKACQRICALLVSDHAP